MHLQDKLLSSFIKMSHYYPQYTLNSILYKMANGNFYLDLDFQTLARFLEILIQKLLQTHKKKVLTDSFVSW